MPKNMRSREVAHAITEVAIICEIPGMDKMFASGLTSSVLFFFFRIFFLFYVGSMCLMRRLHLARSCASSPEAACFNCTVENVRYS